MNLSRRVRRGSLRMMAGWLVLTGSAAAPGEPVPLPQPLTLEAALELAPRGSASEVLAGQYGETAIRARVFECRAQDRTAGRAQAAAGGCGYWHLLTPEQQSRLDVTRRFFDVVEADQAMALEDEAMAVAYVELDRARNRQELGQYSAMAVSERDVDYHNVRRDRYVGQARQRVTRSFLAIALGRPQELPSEVAAPALPQWPANLPDVDGLTARALENNRVLAEWRGRAAADSSLESVVTQLELDLRQAVLELWLSYGVLLAQRDADLTMQGERDLALERSRTLYELEVKADLGDAMTRQTEARLARLRTDHRLHLLLATLGALQGAEIQPPAGEEAS